MSSAFNSITYPPSARLSSSSRGPQPIQAQPSAVPTMSPNGARPEKQTGAAERIRGGCIPCPDGSICYIIPIPCICC